MYFQVASKQVGNGTPTFGADGKIFFYLNQN